LKTAFRSKASGGYSPALRKDGRGARWLLVLVGRVVRWNAHSHLQIWVMTGAACLVSVSAVLLIEGWPRSGAFGFVTMAVICIGVGIRQSYELRRRRTKESR
jgi:CHASE2 domain-containing sensor protein